jgi:hypothetical protein
MMGDPSWLVRVIQCYSKETEELIDIYEMKPVKLEDLQELWIQPKNEPMVAVFDINEKQAVFLKKYVDMEFDFNKYDYQISTYTSDWDATQKDGGYMGEFPPPKELPAFPDAKRVKSK